MISLRFVNNFYFHVIVKATTGDTENNNAMNGFTAFGKIHVRKVKSINK